MINHENIRKAMPRPSPSCSSDSNMYIYMTLTGVDSSPPGCSIVKYTPLIRSHTSKPNSHVGSGSKKNGREKRWSEHRVAKLCQDRRMDLYHFRSILSKIVIAQSISKFGCDLKGSSSSQSFQHEWSCQDGVLRARGCLPMWTKETTPSLNTIFYTRNVILYYVYTCLYWFTSPPKQ